MNIRNDRNIFSKIMKYIFFFVLEPQKLKLLQLKTSEVRKASITKYNEMLHIEAPGDPIWTYGLHIHQEDTPISMDSYTGMFNRLANRFATNSLKYHPRLLSKWYVSITNN